MGGLAMIGIAELHEEGYSRWLVVLCRVRTGDATLNPTGKAKVTVLPIELVVHLELEVKRTHFALIGSITE